MHPNARRALHWAARHPGTVLMLMLCGPWLIGLPEPAWGGVAVGALLLAVPFLILRGFGLLLGDLRGLHRNKP